MNSLLRKAYMFRFMEVVSLRDYVKILKTEQRSRAMKKLEQIQQEKTLFHIFGTI
jgi:23S rRNA U2552 (ribose-2'-O)-methylase RlmE/FtsJ